MTLHDRIQDLVNNRRIHRQNARGATRQAKRFRLVGVRQRRLARKRTAQIHKLRAGTGAKAAVKWALAQVNTIEHPANSNWGPKIEDWIKASGYGSGVPWCQCFVNAAAVHGGAPQLKTGYTPAVLAGPGPWDKVTAAGARAGDLVFFKFPGVSRDSSDHVGILTAAPSGGVVRTVEGNTSSGSGGSQNNGGGVYTRTRPTSIVAGYVRPPYPEG